MYRPNYVRDINVKILVECKRFFHTIFYATAAPALQPTADGEGMASTWRSSLAS